MSIATKKHKVAVVEDDHNLQFMYKLKLENQGFHVTTASDGKTGLEVAEHFKPDIMLLDLMMPIMSGTEMLEKMRSTPWGSDIRVVILTNLSRDEAPQALRFLNVDRYIVKAHHTPSQILEVVQEVLARNGTGNYKSGIV